MIGRWVEAVNNALENVKPYDTDDPHCEYGTKEAQIKEQYAVFAEEKYVPDKYDLGARRKEPNARQGVSEFDASGTFPSGCRQLHLNTLSIEAMTLLK